MDQRKFIIRGLIILSVLVIIIIFLIINSYKKWNAMHVESFETVELTENATNTINSNKYRLDSIIRLMKQKYPDIDINLNNYGLTNPNEDLTSPLKIDSTNLDSEFQVRFIQELQNREITDLESWFALLKERMPTQNEKYDSNKVQSVKHIPTGKLFGVLKNPNQLGQQISVIIDPKNATCLKHMNVVPSEQKNDEPIKNIDLTACDYNPLATEQKFLLETITNNMEFNNMLNPSEYNKYSVSPNYGFGVYPFSVIKVAKHTDNKKTFDTHISSPECITLDNSGLSIEPCTGKESQRFTLTDIPVELSV